MSSNFPPFGRPPYPPERPVIDVESRPVGTGWEGAQPPRAPRREKGPNYFLHILLFLLTIGTTWLAHGAIYSATLMTILTCHEFGHYFAAKYHRVKASLPYFIPLPIPPLGTMGAVIRMSPFIPSRRALFDIGVAGPLAGLAVAIPVTFWGMTASTQVPLQNVQASMHFGDPLLLRLIEFLVLGPRPEGYELLVGQMAFAGWVGMFVTALNLLPISQLDGGHIAYAVFAGRARYVALAVFGGMLVMMFFNGPHYILILALAWFAGIGHPPTMNDYQGLDRPRKWVAALALATFVLCFTPTPVIVDWPPA